jgi:hypothetical protein
LGRFQVRLIPLAATLFGRKWSELNKDVEKTHEHLRIMLFFVTGGPQLFNTKAKLCEHGHLMQPLMLTNITTLVLGLV